MQLVIYVFLILCQVFLLQLITLRFLFCSSGDLNGLQVKPALVNILSCDRRLCELENNPFAVISILIILWVRLPVNIISICTSKYASYFGGGGYQR